MITAVKWHNRIWRLMKENRKVYSLNMGESVKGSLLFYCSTFLIMTKYVMCRPYTSFQGQQTKEFMTKKQYK